MNKLIKDCYLDKNNVDALGDYMPLIDKAKEETQASYSSTILELKKHNVGLNVRYIDHNGEGATISSHLPWVIAESSDGSISEEPDHFTPELRYAKDNNLEFLTRSSDKVGSPFLHRMEHYGVNNSLVYLEFNEHQTIMTYLMCDSKRPETRDLLLTHKNFFKQLVNNTRPMTNLIAGSLEFSKKKRIVIKKNNKQGLLCLNTNRAFSNALLEVRINSVIIRLTPCEVKYLNYLSLGIEISDIAKWFNRQISTTRSHIQNLKEKLEANNLNDLRVVAKVISQQIQR